MATQQTPTRSIAPRHPWENGLPERFKGTLRAECLDQYAFASLAQARRISARVRLEHHAVRPHRELGYRTPAPFKRDGLEQQTNVAPL